jgi:hypothetical protein
MLEAQTTRNDLISLLLSLSDQTYIGAKAIQVLFENFRDVHNSRPVLCVCYTNHALDQFLESLLDVGIDSIVRIGGGCKTKRLEECNLRKCTLKRSKMETISTCRASYTSILHPY